MATERERNTAVYSLRMLLPSTSLMINTDSIVELYFIEDIFSYCMTGKLVFNDTFGIFEYGPLTGMEQLVLSYGGDEDKEMLFDIWKVEKISQSTTASSSTGPPLIQIHFVDPTFIPLSRSVYSRSWNNTKCSTIMSHILKYMAGFKDLRMVIEDSENSIDFVMPYWTPMKALKWIQQRSKGNSGLSSGYLCYNNTKDDFTINLQTLNYLFSERNHMDEIKYGFEGIGIDTNYIIDWWLDGIDKAGYQGLSGGHWKGFDTSKKSFIDYENTYKDNVEKTVINGKFSLFPNISNLDARHTLIGESNLESIRNLAYSEWLRRYVLQNIVNVQLTGSEKRYAGMQIEIEWPSYSEEDKFPNKQMRGKYLIKSITHAFGGMGTSQNYIQRMVLIKNGYTDSDYAGLVKANRSNI